MRYYAGIGSRDTPEDVCHLMTDIAQCLESSGLTLRSGHADGADKAFERGALSAREIFLPWKDFNGSRSHLWIERLAREDPQLEPTLVEIFRKFHPAPDKCSPGAQKLHMRNALQILGRDLKTPSEAVICWTKGGKILGGTGQALRIANFDEIPVFNLALEDDRKRLWCKYDMDGKFEL